MPPLNHKILAVIPTFETYCSRLALATGEPEQLTILYEKDVGLGKIFEAFQDIKLLLGASNQALAVYTSVLEELEKGNEKKSTLKSRWAVLGVSALVGIGTVVAAPLVIAAAGFTSGGIAAGSFGTWLMSTYGGAVTSGSLCAILQSAGAVGLSAGASAGIGLASAGTTMGVGALVTGLKKSERKGLAEHCKSLVERGLITSSEQIKIAPSEKSGNRKAAVQELFELLLKKNDGLKTLLGDDGISLPHAEEVVTNVFNHLLEDLSARSPDDNGDTNGPVIDSIVQSKLCVLATVAGVWSAVIAPVVLSAYGLESGGIEGYSELAKLFIGAVECSLLDKIKEPK